MIGPPAIPNLTGVLIPGNVIGNAPNSIPSDIPMKTAKRFGLFNRLISYRIRFSHDSQPVTDLQAQVGRGQQVYTGTVHTRNIDTVEVAKAERA